MSSQLKLVVILELDSLHGPCALEDYFQALIFIAEEILLCFAHYRTETTT